MKKANQKFKPIIIIVSFIIIAIIVLSVVIIKLYSTNSKKSEITNQPISEQQTPDPFYVSNYTYTMDKINSNIVKFKVYKNLHVLTFLKIKDLLLNNPNTSDKNDFIKILCHIFTKATEFNGFYFEVIGIKKSELSHTVFEFVLIKTSLPDTQNSTNFDQYVNVPEMAVVFDSLSGSTTKLVCPHKTTSSYNAHLAIYSRGCTHQEFGFIWDLAFQTFFSEIDKAGNEKIYLSTHGNAVSWLHIRIERTPKYYSYPEYK